MGTRQPRSEREQAARDLGKHAQSGDAGRELIVGLGGIPPIVDLLGAGEAVSSRQEAAGVIAQLAFQHDGCQDAIRQAGAIPWLVDLLGSIYSPAARKRAAVALGHLADGHLKNKMNIMHVGGVKSLVTLVRSVEARKAKVEALYALGQFCEPDPCKTMLVRCGGIPALVGSLGDNEPMQVRTRARRMLLVLATGTEEHQRLIKESGGERLILSLYDELDEHYGSDAKA